MGSIGVRWRQWGGVDGPFGAALDAEQPVGDSASRRQRFEHGEILWAPDERLVLSVVRIRNDVCLEWWYEGAHYQYRVNCFYNGEPQHLDRLFSVPGSGRLNRQRWLRLQGLGRYDFHVAGFDGGHTSGWSQTVGVDLDLDPTAEPPPFPVTGAFAARWHELGGITGALGKPLAAAHQFQMPDSTAWEQNFERGQLIAHIAQGFHFVLSAHQDGACIELNWGGSDVAYNDFTIGVLKNGRPFWLLPPFAGLPQPFTVRPGNDTAWARPGRGSGCARTPILWSDRDLYSFIVYPSISLPVFPPQTTPGPRFPEIAVRLYSVDALLGTAQPADAGAAQAFACHRIRADAVARHHVTSRGWDGPPGPLTEDNGLQLIAHLQVESQEPGHAAPGRLPTRLLAHALLRNLWWPEGQLMGTSYDDGVPGSRWGDYDMGLTCLLPALIRYRDVLTPEVIDFALDRLLPPGLVGPANTGLEWYRVLTEHAPETENHLLMIYTSKYLVNNLLHERTGEQQYDNTVNGVNEWLLERVQRLARFDFLEFNARPYQRLSLHALLNLHEFGDQRLATAAGIVLDYAMMKFAVSSTRNRRVPPFRRLREKVNKPGGDTDDLIAPSCDQLPSLFGAYVGHTDPEGRPLGYVFDYWVFNAILAGLAPYRPPVAAYLAALEPVESVQHRFYHGQRPRMTESEEDAEGGVEIYVHTPAFVLSAGGSFLNSGYGLDELQGHAQVAVAQSTTLIPRRADATFGELIRFDPFPSDRDVDGDEQLPRDAVNLGVHLGFACGADMQVPQRWIDLAHAAWEGPWLFLDLGQQLGFHLVAYRTRLTSDDSERLRVQYDSVCQTFGWLYVRTATGDLPFPDLVARVRERNTFPERLAWDAKYDFVTPEEPRRTYTFWNRPEQMKRIPRVFAVDGVPVLVDGFTSLPLVDGPYLRSEGHTGRLEIRAPGQPPGTAPLVLDHRDVHNPLRIDNAAAWPRPHLDRAAAVVDVATRLHHDNPLDPRRPLRVLRSLDHLEVIVQPDYWFLRCQFTNHLIAMLLTEGQTGDVETLTAESIDAGRRAAEQGRPSMDVAVELNSLGYVILQPYSLELAAMAERVAVEVLRDHPPADA